MSTIPPPGTTTRPPSTASPVPAVPVLVAPMAGGPTTPELVAAVVRAGGGGFLAGGMRTADEVRAQVEALRALLGADAGTGGSAADARWGVNLFVPDAVNTAVPAEGRTPGARAARRSAVEAFRARLGPVAAELDADLPPAEAAMPDPDTERAAFEAMLEAAEEQRWPQVSFTFGLPEAEVFGRLDRAGSRGGVTVTSAAEARAAVEHGAAFLVVQGPEAGGHRSTLDPTATPDETGLDDLLAQVRAAVGQDVPLTAAGGVADAARVRALLAAGAQAVSVGTAFLLAREAGTSGAHRRALTAAASAERFVTSDGAADTAVTRSYTGRWARSLRTAFMTALPDAPAAYPELNALTKDLRARAAAVGDLDRVHLWAGTQAHRARAADAAVVLGDLTP